MTITAHVVVGGILVLERLYAPATWVQLAIWTPVLILLSLWLLPRVKGTLIGYQWALRMHGFGNTAFDDPEFGTSAREPKSVGSLALCRTARSSIVPSTKYRNTYPPRRHNS